MKFIFEEYGGIIITGAVIVALIALAGVLLAVDGPVQDAFVGVVDSLFSQSGLSTTPTPTPTPTP